MTTSPRPPGSQSAAHAPKQNAFSASPFQKGVTLTIANQWLYYLLLTYQVTECQNEEFRFPISMNEVNTSSGISTQRPCFDVLSSNLLPSAAWRGATRTQQGTQGSNVSLNAAASAMRKVLHCLLEGLHHRQKIFRIFAVQTVLRLH